MKTIMKNLKHLFAALLLLCATVATAHDFAVGGIYYNITSTSDNLTVGVTYQGDSYGSFLDEYSGNVVIPESVTYNGKTYRITSIEDYAFRNCSTLSSVVISNSVTSIDYYAFYGCTGLTSIIIGKSVTGIGNSVFYNCKNLKTVINLSSLTFSKGSNSYGYVAYYAEKVINVSNSFVEDDFIFGKVSSENSLVYYSGNDAELTLPQSYNGENYVIAADAFKNNTSITSIVIPNGVTGIGSNAFYGCTNLKTVINFSSFFTITIRTSGYGYVANYANKVVNVPNGTIEGDYVWVEVNGVKTLAGYLGGDTELVLPSGNVNYAIGAKAFENRSALTRITIPNCVTSIGDKAFSGCSGLTSVTIPNSVTSFGSSAFSGCTGLTSIEIPGSVTNIGAGVFCNCTGLTSIEIPDVVTSIGDYAFSGCTGLTSIEIPDVVTSIGDYAFSGCTGLTSIEIPGSVTSIGDYAFSG